MVGRAGALPGRADQIVVDHGAHIVKAELFNLGNFMRGAEAIEEMQEGNARLQRRGMRDQRQVYRLLHRVRREQGESGLASGHGIGVIAKDGVAPAREWRAPQRKSPPRSPRPQSCTCWGSSAAAPATR